MWHTWLTLESSWWTKATLTDTLTQSRTKSSNSGTATACRTTATKNTSTSWKEISAWKTLNNLNVKEKNKTLQWELTWRLEGIARWCWPRTNKHSCISSSSSKYRSSTCSKTRAMKIKRIVLINKYWTADLNMGYTLYHIRTFCKMSNFCLEISKFDLSCM